MKIQKTLLSIVFLAVIFLSSIVSAGTLKIRETVKDFSFSQHNFLSIVSNQNLRLLSNTVLGLNNKLVYINGNTLSIEENFKGWYSKSINVLIFDHENKLNNNYYLSIEAETPFISKAESIVDFSKNNDAWIFINKIGLAEIHKKGRASVNLDFLGLAIGSVVYSLKIVPEEKELTQSDFDSALYGF